MTTGIYLEDHPPRQTQFRDRRAKETGCIVVHTAESVMDTVGPDTGAEAVAAFIRGRTGYGSYHRLCDADSVVKLVRLTKAAYGDGTGSNEWAIHISFACRTTDWARMSPAKRAAFMTQGAIATAEAMHYLRVHCDVTVPLRRISKAESDAGQPGFIAHGDRDPGRRTDPGEDFPWADFFGAVAARVVRPDAPVERTRGRRIDESLRLLWRALRGNREDHPRKADRIRRARQALKEINPRRKK